MSDLEKPRLSRLTAIVTQLQSKRILTATGLAKKYNVSVRTIYRDIRTLENSGIPIITKEGKGYSLVEGFSLPPVMFSENEANALITAEQLILKNKDESLVEHYKNAIVKIRSVLRSKQKDKAELLSQRITFRNNFENQKTSNYLMEIQSAVTNFKLMAIEYHSLENITTKRAVEPFALYSTQDNWLLIAFCRLRGDFRAFRLDRIVQLHTKSEGFEPHKMTLQEYFDMCEKKSQYP